MLADGDSNYTTTEVSTTENTKSDAQATFTTEVMTTQSTVGSLHENTEWVNPQSITVSSNGTLYTLTVSDTHTVDDILTSLAGLGVHGAVNDGKLTLVGDEQAYIVGITDELKTALKLSDVNYNTSEGQKIANTDSTNTTFDVVEELNTSLNALEFINIRNGLAANAGHNGTPENYTINGIHNGVAFSYTISENATIGDVLEDLELLGINGYIREGKLTLSGNQNSYITDLGEAVVNAFLLADGDSNYTTTEVSITENTKSDAQATFTTEVMTTQSTVGSLHKDTEWVNPQSITVSSNGTLYTLTVSDTHTVDDILTSLAGLGVHGAVNDGKLTLVGDEQAYIVGITDELKTALKLSDVNYNTSEGQKIANTDSTNTTFNTTEILTTDSNVLEFVNRANGIAFDAGYNGTPENYTISGFSNGNTFTYTVPQGATIDDMLTTLAGYGISGKVEDGIITLTGSNNAYISDIGDSLAAAFKLADGDSNYTTTEHTKTTNTSSNTQEYSTVETLTTQSTIASLHRDETWVNPQTITVNSDGILYTITVSDTHTIDDMLTSLAGLGIHGSVNDGKLTLASDNEAFIVSISDELKTALKLTDDNYSTVESSKVINTDSNRQSETIQEAATGETLLKDLINSAGDTTTGYSLVLSTTSNAGNNLVTLSFTETSSIYDIIDELAQYGLNASIDSTGRFAVNSSTLTDFDISGDLGTFIMGAYEKVYNEGTVSSVSTNLMAKTESYMNDDTLLSEIGITSGNVTLYKDGNSYTIVVDASQTVGDFRTQLGEYGINSSIIEGKLQLIGNGVVYLETPDTDASNLVDIMGLDKANWDLGDYAQKSEKLSDTATNVVTATMDIRICDLTDENGVNLEITNGQIYVYQNGARNLINIDTNDTIADLAEKLKNYGITVGISSNGKIYFDGNNNSYLTTDGLTSDVASNILTKLGITSWETRYDSTSETLDYEEEEDSKDVGSTKLTDLQDADGNSLGITEGTYYVYQNGVRSTETITSDTTVNDFRATMASYGLITDFNEDGSLSVGAYNNTYLATSATAGDDTNAIDVLFETWNFVNVYNSNGLETPTPETVAITTTTKLADIENASYQAGYITVVKDGVKTDIELTADATVGDLIDELSMFGFETIINSNGELIIKNTGNSLLQAYNGVGQASNALEILGIGLDDWISTNTYESGTISVVTTTTEDVSATRDTLLSELGISTGEYYIYNNGVKYTAMVSSDETIGSLMDTLNSFGIQTSLVDNGSGAVLSIHGNGDSYVAKSTSINNASDVVEKLFTTSETSLSYTAQKEINKTLTSFVTATEDTLLSTYDNNLLVSQGDLSVTVDGINHTVRILGTDTIDTFVEKLRDTGLNASYLDGKILITNGSINTDGTTSSVMTNLNIIYSDAIDGYALSSESLAQSTTYVEDRIFSVANYANVDTAMDLLNITSGTLTVYRDGEKATLQIDSSKNFSDIQDQLDGRFGDVKIKFEEGYLTFYSTTKHVNIEVGSTTDTSNFSAITGIQRTEDGKAKSARELYCVNASSVIMTSGIFRNGNVREGSFRIGDAKFTIDSTTTISDIVSQINASQKANATAYWDSIDAKLVIQSRTTGAALINIEAGTSNFTDVMGLTNSEWDCVSQSIAAANSETILSTLGMTNGSFNIGSATINVDSSESIDDLISSINDSGVIEAAWDNTNKVIVFNKTTEAPLNFIAGTSNALDILGLTSVNLGDADSDGNADVSAVLTKMNVEAQEIGENAKFAINGTYYTSTKNEIGSDVSRIEGLTINLKGISEGETTITIERDKETIANTVSEVVDAYNELITNVDKEITKGGTLDDQFTLKLIRNQIRNMMTGSILTSGVYKNLDSIGISLEKASANNINTENIDTLYFDKDKFISAFDADRNSLQGLLIGVSETDFGIFGELEKNLEKMISFSSGYFQTAEKSYNNQISKITEKIKKAETAVERYRERLEAKFASMDLLISKIQNQYSSFLSGGI